MCLALNIFFEARNQSLEGQLAVADVVFNRVRDPRYPDNVCDVVYQAKRTSSGRVILNSATASLIFHAIEMPSGGPSMLL